MPASTASASIVRMMNRDGTRMKFKPGSQYTYRHSSNGQAMNISVETHGEHQVEGRSQLLAQRVGRAGQLTIGDHRQHQHQDSGKQEGVGFLREGSPAAVDCR